MIKVSTTGMVVSLKTDLRFPIPGQQGHGGRIIQLGGFIAHRMKSTDTSELINLSKEEQEQPIQEQLILPIEAGISGIVDVILQNETYFVLDDNGNVWQWHEKAGKDDAEPVPGMKNVIKIVDAGSAVYALTQDGDVYAWGSNEKLMIVSEESRELEYVEPVRLDGLSGIVDMDAGNGKAFAVDSSGRLYVWGLDRYLVWEENMHPELLEEPQDLTDNVGSIFMGAGNFHYFVRKDGSVFSIMDAEYTLDRLGHFIFPCFSDKEQVVYWQENANVFDMCKGSKTGRPILYEMGEKQGISFITADEYTMYLYREDNTLWYWNSDRITYHDNESAGALIETAYLDYRGSFEQVDIRKILGIKEESEDTPKIISVCPGKENVLFLLDNGQVFMSGYVTKEVRDVEYYNTGNTNPNRMYETSIYHQMHLKEVDFWKLDYEDIVSISSDKDKNFFLVNKEREIWEPDITLTMRTYEDYSQFPFESMSYVSNDVYEDLEQIYADIGFKSEFKKGNMEIYDFYKEKYQQLLHNEITFYDAEESKDYYIEQYGEMKVYGDEKYDLNKHTYFFFDIDEDDAPELGVTEYLNGTKTKRFIYIFKYDIEKERMIIWKKLESSRYFLIGSRMLTVAGEGFSRFCVWDEDGEVELEVYFRNDAFYSNGTPVYMVSLPAYADKNMLLSITEEMREQGYYGERESFLFFKLTEEQYKKLTEKFFQAEREAEVNIEEVSYTYEELFGSNLCF